MTTFDIRNGKSVSVRDWKACVGLEAALFSFLKS
jgi:hypothetical protein